MADSHEFIDLGDLLVAIGPHDQRLAVSRYFQFSIRFLFDLGQLGQERAKVAPFEIMRRRMTKDGLISALVRSCEFWLCFHSYPLGVGDFIKLPRRKTT